MKLWYVVLAAFLIVACGDSSPEGIAKGITKKEAEGTVKPALPPFDCHELPDWLEGNARAVNPDTLPELWRATIKASTIEPICKCAGKVLGKLCDYPPNRWLYGIYKNKKGMPIGISIIADQPDNLFEAYYISFDAQGKAVAMFPIEHSLGDMGAISLTVSQRINDNLIRCESKISFNERLAYHALQDVIIKDNGEMDTTRTKVIFRAPQEDWTLRR